MTPYEVAGWLGRYAHNHCVRGDILIRADGDVLMEHPTAMPPVTVVKLSDRHGDDDWRGWSINIRTRDGWAGWSNLASPWMIEHWVETLRDAIEIADDANREVREGSL